MAARRPADATSVLLCEVFLLLNEGENEEGQAEVSLFVTEF